VQGAPDTPGKPLEVALWDEVIDRHWLVRELHGLSGSRCRVCWRCFVSPADVAFAAAGRGLRPRLPSALVHGRGRQLVMRAAACEQDAACRQAQRALQAAVAESSPTAHVPPRADRPQPLALVHTPMCGMAGREGLPLGRRFATLKKHDLYSLGSGTVAIIAQHWPQPTGHRGPAPCPGSERPGVRPLHLPHPVTYPTAIAPTMRYTACQSIDALGHDMAPLLLTVRNQA
jgi:hypothetical protein